MALPVHRLRSRLAALLFLFCCVQAGAVTLWSDLGSTLIHETGPGVDILGGAIKEDGASDKTLYFKFHIGPLSDVSTEEYSAAFQLFEGHAERLGVGNSLKAWAYSAFNTTQSGEFNLVFGDMDLRSGRPESSAPGVFLPYELPRRGIENTIVFKVQFVPGADDLVTVWLNPDLAPGATETNQRAELTTRFEANCSFDQIRLRHNGGGGGWNFSDLHVATAFGDLVRGGSEPGGLIPAHQYAIRAWQREQGLPQDAVHALAQTRDGYIWLAHDDGISRFDGVRFVTFGIREGFRGGKPQLLFEDAAGTLWAGTEAGGMAGLFRGGFTTLTTADGLPSNSITAIGEDPERQLWVGTSSGLALFRDGKLVNSPLTAGFKGQRVSLIYKDSHGVMWVGVTGEGIFRYLEDKIVPFSDPSVDDLLKNPHCLLDDRAGRLWIGAGEDYVLCREQDQWRRHRIPRHLATHHVNSLVETPDGSVWAGSVSEGLFQFRQGGLSALNASHGLSDNFVEALIVDHEGNLWVGTTAGLSQVRQKNFTVLAQSEGLGYGSVYGLAEVAPGIIWAGKPDDGLYRWNGRNFGRLSVTNLAGAALGPAPQVTALLAMRDGSCYVAGQKGILRFDAPASEEPESVIELESESVLSLAEDTAGALWAGTRMGKLWKKTDAQWTEIPVPQSHAIGVLAADVDGSMWVGTEGSGLYRVKDKVLQRLTTSDGLLSDVIQSLLPGPEGSLWIGTGGGGLSRLSQGKLVSFTTREGLLDDSISQIVEDEFGRVWLGSKRGISFISKRELDGLPVRDNRQETLLAPRLHPQTFTRAEGLMSEHCAGGFSPAGLLTKAGFLWFPTTKGVVVIDPRTATGDAPPPSVVLENVIVEGVNTQPGGLSSTLRVPPGKRRIEFQYTALSYAAPQKMRFRYRLEGLDKEWTEAEGRRTAFYGHVPPGDYRFQVTACNSDGVWNQVGAVIMVSVRQYFWQTWWFIGAGSFMAILSVAGLVRFAETKKAQARLRLLENERAIEKERARIAQDLHDDLGSSLTRISLLSDLLADEKDSPAHVIKNAEKISQSAAQTVRALEEIVWALRPGSDTLQSLFDYIAHFANELFQEDGMSCRLDLPHDLPACPLPPETRHNIFLIVKEALTNALKHSGATEVRIAAKVQGALLELEVSDNGKGYPPGAREPVATHDGLVNMERRAADLAGTIQYESTPGTGTMVRFSMKLPVPG